jgi:hypothetical protein
MIGCMHKELLGINSGIVLCGVNRNIEKNNSSLEIMYFGFQKERKHVRLGKFTKKWFGLYIV